jgi:hypothetical protein
MRAELREAIGHEAFLALREMGAHGADARRARSLIRSAPLAALRAAKVALWSDGTAAVLTDADRAPRKHSGATVERQVSLLEFARQIGKQVAAGMARKGAEKNDRQ